MATRPKRAVKKPAPSPSEGTPPSRPRPAARRPRPRLPTARSSPRPGPGRRPRSPAATARRRAGQGCARHRRVAHQGQDHRQVPRPRLRREGHRRPPARSAHPRAGRGRRARVRARVRHHQGQDQDARRAQEGGQGRLHDLPRHRPRPRGRGDRLARGRPDRRASVPDPPGAVPRDHQGRRARGDGGARRDRRAEGGRPAGPPDPRPAGRLQGEPDPLEDHQERALRRPGADRRAPAHRRARAGDPRLQAAGVLDHRGAAATRTGRPSRPRSPRSDGNKPQLHNEADARAVVDAVRALPFVVTKVEQRSAGRSGRARRSPPARSSRKPPRSSASARGAPCARRRISTRASRSARKARSASSPTCGPTRRAWRTPRSPSARELHRRAATARRICPTQPNAYSDRKNARVQDAHEAIRPTDVRRRPEQVQSYLEPDQFQLYQLIWQRFVASQMTPAVFDMTMVDFDLGRYLFRATGSVHGVRRLPRALHRGAREGGGEDDGRSRRRSRRSRRATGWRSGRSPRRSTSPSRRRASPRRAW